MSQEWPRCGHRHNPRGRAYACPACRFQFHRDSGGAVNIRRKYVGLDPVVGAMALARGVLWPPHPRVRVAHDERERIPALLWLGRTSRVLRPTPVVGVDPLASDGSRS